MTSMHLKLDARWYLSERPFELISTTAAGEGLWVVDEIAPITVPLVPGDVLRADDEGWVTDLVRPSPLGLFTVLPNLRKFERDDLTKAPDSDEVQRALAELAQWLSGPMAIPHVRNDGLYIMAATESMDALRRGEIEAHPLVFGVEVERYPGGKVHEHPNRVGDRGPTRPIDLDWVKDFVRNEPDDQNDWTGVAGDVVVPDALPEEWT